MRGRYSRNAPATAGVPHIVVVVDGGLLEGDSGLLTGSGLDSVTILDLCGFSSSLSASRGLRLVVAPDQVGAVSSAGVEKFARPDSVSTTTAQTFGRRMAPYRAASQNAVDSGTTTRRRGRGVRCWASETRRGSTPSMPGCLVRGVIDCEYRSESALTDNPSNSTSRNPLRTEWGRTVYVSGQPVRANRSFYGRLYWG